MARSPPPSASRTGTTRSRTSARSSPPSSRRSPQNAMTSRAHQNTPVSVFSIAALGVGTLLRLVRKNSSLKYLQVGMIKYGPQRRFPKLACRSGHLGACNLGNGAPSRTISLKESIAYPASPFCSAPTRRQDVRASLYRVDAENEVGQDAGHLCTYLDVRILMGGRYPTS